MASRALFRRLVLSARLGLRAPLVPALVRHDRFPHSADVRGPDRRALSTRGITQCFKRFVLHPIKCSDAPLPI